MCERPLARPSPPTLAHSFGPRRPPMAWPGLLWPGPASHGPARPPMALTHSFGLPTVLWQRHARPHLRARVREHVGRQRCITIRCRRCRRAPHPARRCSCRPRATASSSTPTPARPRAQPALRAAAARPPVRKGQRGQGAQEDALCGAAARAARGRPAGPPARRAGRPTLVLVL